MPTIIPANDSGTPIIRMAEYLEIEQRYSVNVNPTQNNGANIIN